MLGFSGKKGGIAGSKNPIVDPLLSIVMANEENHFTFYQ